ncbi:MAG TPA: SgcJ/EcaC family oxidoreductase [Verrucomicrobiae bacterium]|nr:SgcJ/EcaC family oxidoreductase [Verrucomicrobiae bacterium]
MKTTNEIPVEPVIVPENGGTVLNTFGDRLTVKLGAHQTQGALSIIVDTIPPGGGPPLHSHDNEDEFFIVREGRINYFMDNHWTELGPGGVVFAPRGRRHAFRNTGTAPASHYVLTTPGGFERFFAATAAEFAKPGGPNMERVLETSSAHGVHITGEPPQPPAHWTPPLTQTGGKDEQAIRQVIAQLERAWNAGDSAGFAAPFAEDADFVDVLGRYHRGRAAIEAGHRHIFDTIYRGSRNRYTIEATRFVGPDVALVFVHATLLSHLGQDVDDPGRDRRPRSNMSEGQARPTFILGRKQGEWQIVAFQNTKVAGGPPVGEPLVGKTPPVSRLTRSSAGGARPEPTTY